MPEPFDQLLEATLQHLHTLKEQGARYVAVSGDTLASLKAGTLPRAAQSAPHTRAASPISPQTPLPKEPAPRPFPQTATPLTNEAKAQAMAELRERAMQCFKCPKLASSRKNVVFGVGNINAEIMFVGEAPGADEDQQGEQVYIANILKCRPDTPGQSAGNRKPRPDEMETCIPYLHAQIDLIKPKVLIALGATAVEGLLGRSEGITRLRGNWKTYRGIPLMPTYHPAYLLRNQAPSEKRRVWEDMLRVMEKAGMPITEKQRNYFL